MIAFPVSPRVTICAASLTAPRFAEMLPAGIEPAGIEPAGIEPAGMSASVLGWQSAVRVVDARARVLDRDAAGGDAAGRVRLDRRCRRLVQRQVEVGAARNLQVRGDLRAGRQPGQRELVVVDVGPRGDVPDDQRVLRDRGRVPAGLGSSFGSPFWVTSTGAWSSAKYLPLPAVTSTELLWVPRVRPAKELKSNRTCRVSVLPPHGLPGASARRGSSR